MEKNEIINNLFVIVEILFIRYYCVYQKACINQIVWRLLFESSLIFDFNAIGILSRKKAVANKMAMPSATTGEIEIIWVPDWKWNDGKASEES